MFASRGIHGVGACFVLRRRLLLCMLVLACSGPRAQAQTPAEGPKEDAVAKFEKSPWLIAPVFQSNPKLGTSLGAMAGYIHYFDEKSRPSIFAVMLQHSNTD